MKSIMRQKLSIAVALIAATVLSDALDAQRRGGFGGRNRQRPPSKTSKNHDTVKAAFRSVVAKARKSTVVVECDGRQVALGTIVGADGYIVTKTSELEEGEIVCKLYNGEELEAERLSDHYDNDLVMLKVHATDLVPVQWSQGVGAEAGSWVASPGMKELPIAIGVMSAQVHDRDKAKFRRLRGRTNTNSAWLGVGFEGEREVRLGSVQGGSAAEAAGLKIGDVILEFASRRVRSQEQLVSRLGRYRPGDKVSLKVRRGTKELTLEATLGRNPNLPQGGRGQRGQRDQRGQRGQGDQRRQRGNRGGRGRGSGSNDRKGPPSRQERIWGPLSDVRIGFTEVIQHDSVLEPSQCGGPLVNLDGKVVGINISRVGRIETLALTGRAVRKMLEDLKQPRKAADSSDKKGDKKGEKKK